MVRVRTLVENTSVSPELRCVHGLSFYIETPKHKILFDVGPNEVFSENAKLMGIDLAAVDTVVISHGHADHAGALGLFLSRNNTAKVYIKESAFEKHYSQRDDGAVSISLNENLRDHPQLVFTGEDLIIDDEIRLISGVRERRCFAKANKKILMEADGQLVYDDFRHEQNMVITDGDRRVLFSGCSHSGIINIQAVAEKAGGAPITHVIGGFHMHSPGSGEYESDELINEVAETLNSSFCEYYTCHCTGMTAYEKMKTVMGDKLRYLSAGSEIVI